MSSSDVTQSSETSPGYGLPAIFEALRADLEAAQTKLLDSNKQPVMKLGTSEVELTFTLVEDSKRKGGLNLRVFGVGFGGDLEKGQSQSAVHRLKVTLEPTGPMGILAPNLDKP